MSASPIRVAAINFLNPAPLMWDFEHAPYAEELSRRYKLNYTAPSRCAADLLAGDADLGLVPIAALTAELAVVPGCTIASLDRVRSIQLIVKGGRGLDDVRTVAADTASRSSLAYAQILFRKFIKVDPVFISVEADPLRMLETADAALVIGDPALLALEEKATIEARFGPCQWFDLAHEWRLRTGLPWVAAVWAVRPKAVTDAACVVEDLQRSRDHGLAKVEEIVREWLPRIALPEAVIRSYLTENIHYVLDEPCIEAMSLFRRYSAEVNALPALEEVQFFA